jgi:hypothetical protein
MAGLRSKESNSNMSDIKIDLTLKDLDVQTASVIVAYLGGKSPAAAIRADAAETKTTKAEPKAESNSKKTKKNKASKPAPPEEEEEDEDDWDDGDETDDNSKYASVKKWRELATLLVGAGYNTAPKLLAKCQELADICPALDKIPADNLVTRCDRAIEVLGA